MFYNLHPLKLNRCVNYFFTCIISLHVIISSICAQTLQANRVNNQAGASRHAVNASQPSTNSNQPNITQELFTRLMQDVMNSGSTNPAVPTPAPAANNVGPAASTSVTPPVTISPEQLVCINSG